MRNTLISSSEPMVMRRAALALLLAITGCGTPIAGTPQAEPGPPVVQVAPSQVPPTDVRDRVFLETLRIQGVTLAGSEQIREAHGVCSSLDRGIAPSELLANYQRGGFSTTESGYFVGASVAAYCPEHLQRVTG